MPAAAKSHPEQRRAARREPATATPERSDELERDRDSQRQAVERLVEAEVHRAEGQPERGDQPQVAPRRPRSGGRETTSRIAAAKSEAQQRAPAGAEVVEERRRERRAELDRRDANSSETHGGTRSRLTPRHVFKA